MSDVNPDWRPLEDDDHDAQLAAILRLFDDRKRTVVEIGAGDGRVCAPLMAAGHDVLAIDADPDAERACREQGIPVRCADVLDASTALQIGSERVDAILCVGNTFMLFADPAAASRLLRRIRDALNPGGVFILDNFPAALWAEVHDGAWCEGVSEAGDMQMIWAKGDNVFALRQGEEVDRDDWSLRPTDRRHRLWSLGELTLLADAAGFQAPATDESGELLVFRTN